MTKRTRIEPGTPVQVELTCKEWDLLEEHAFLATEQLEAFERSIDGKARVAMLTLDDIEEFIDHVAAAGNHAEPPAVERAFSKLFERLHKLQRSYDDGNWGETERQ